MIADCSQVALFSIVKVRLSGPVLYYQKHQIPITNYWIVSFYLGFSWSIITIVIDLFGWVLIKHPWSMTLKEMYLDYQPWISLIYLSIFVSPFIATLFLG